MNLNHDDSSAPRLRFYQLKSATSERMMVLFVQKAFKRGLRILLVCPETEKLMRLDRFLWSFDSSAFLPHARREDKNFRGLESQQPILLSEEAANVNDAGLLIAWDCFPALADTDIQDRCFLFDGDMDMKKQEARLAWKEWSAYKPKFWQIG